MVILTLSPNIRTQESIDLDIKKIKMIPRTTPDYLYRVSWVAEM